MTGDNAPHALRDYAFVADGRRGALIGPRGDISFLCVPDWHSSGVFANILGGRGHYTVAPADPRFVWGGFYDEGTLIWTSRWITQYGIVQSREALAFPGDAHRAVILRQIYAVDGDAVVDVTLDMRADFGRCHARELHRDGPAWSGRAGELWWRWGGGSLAQIDGGTLRTRLAVAAGERHDLLLEVGDRPLDDPPEPARMWRTTENAWRSGAPRLRDSIASRDAAHAVAVLRGMTHPDGGTVAAATTSLPERAEAGRNYDYRYAWIRDQCFIGRAGAAAGVDESLDRSVRFVAARLLEDGPRLAPVYRADATGPVPAEQRLGFLPGYPGGRVVVGNHANRQFQLDVFGEALLLFAAAGRLDRLDADGWRAMRIAADVIADRWRQPDAGIWELDDRRWTHSLLTCVAGLRAAADRATAERAGAWTALADAILGDAARHHMHPSGRWQRARDDDRIDGALLLPAIYGAIPVSDPRSEATLAAVRTELDQDGYIYRFRPDGLPLGEAEGAFLLCGFTLARALHEAGDPASAIRLFERSRAACGPSGIYSEEYDVRQRQMRGNLPQSFVHAVLLETAVALGRPAAPARETP